MAIEEFSYSNSSIQFLAGNTGGVFEIHFRLIKLHLLVEMHSGQAAFASRIEKILILPLKNRLFFPKTDPVGSLGMS